MTIRGKVNQLDVTGTTTAHFEFIRQHYSEDTDPLGTTLICLERGACNRCFLASIFPDGSRMDGGDLLKSCINGVFAMR